MVQMERLKISLWHGLAELLRSPSGLFALLSLIAVTIVTLKQPSVGGVAFAAFFPVVVSILAYVEHKETMKQMEQPPGRGSL
jgi:hypothetical protein